MDIFGPTLAYNMSKSYVSKLNLYSANFLYIKIKTVHAHSLIAIKYYLSIVIQLAGKADLVHLHLSEQ